MNDITIESCERSLTGSGYSESEFEAPPIKAVDQTNPILTNHKYKTLNTDTYQFEVTFFDPNFESPDLSYGVLVHLIAPNGTALGSIEMDTLIENPSFSEGDYVKYNYTLDTSSYDEGLWHYWFSTKDKISGDLVFIPEESYFVGPDTSNTSLYLSSPRISTSVGTFFEDEGWADNDFTFYINWWDYVNHTSPSKVNLCIIPANISTGEGVSNIYGIRKFEMSAVDSTPNYTNPVTFFYALNFTEWNYLDTELGSFYHYFEAERNNGEFSYYLLSEGENHVNLEGPYVKSLEQTTLNFDCTSNSGDLFGTANTAYSFTLEYSDPEGIDISSPPVLIVSKGDNEYEYEMDLIELSPDNRSCEYTICLSGSDFKSGAYSTDVDLPETWVGIVAGVTFYILDLVESTFQGIISTILNLGVIPSTVLVGASGLALLDRIEYFIPVVAGVGVYLVSSILASLNAHFFSDNNAGKALGFSIGCLLLYIALKSCIGEGIFSPNKFSSLFSWAQNTFNTWLLFSSIMEFTSSLSAMIFPEGTFLVDLFSMAGNFFNIFPMYFLFINIVNTLALLLGVCNARQSSCTTILYRGLQIYSSILICTSIIGFMAFTTSFGMDLNIYAN